MANIIAAVQKPTLVLAHNKTLAAQLYGEFKEFFPDNAVQYFVSYYDYYQPEAYIPQSDTYIEKDATQERRDRPAAPRRDQRALRAARRDHRGQRLLHLRPGLARGLHGADPGAQSAATGGTATTSSTAWWASSTRGTTSTSPGAPSACGAT